MFFKFNRATACVLAVATLTGCGGNVPIRGVASDEYTSPTSQDAGPSSAGGFAGDLGIRLGVSKEKSADQGGGGMAVNAYLWRGTVDTLSFMPLASADPFGGVVITDWWQPPAAPGERFKITAYILSRTLRSDGIKLSTFRQVQQGGQWTDTVVSPGLNSEFEDRILARARELRSASAN